MNFRFSKYKKNKEKKEGGSRRKVAVIVSIAIIIAVVGACVAAAAVAAGNRIDVRIIDEDAGEYMLVNVPENYSFSIEKKKPVDDVKAKDFVVYDIEGNPVKTSNAAKEDIIRVDAPDKGYEKGGVYTLDLQDKGTFQAEDYDKAKKITFIVAQKDMRELTYQDGVLQPGDKNVTVSKDTISIKGTYKSGNIIVADTNNDDVDEIYQLKDTTVKKGVTTAAYEDPSAENVYKDINVFYSDSVDFRDAQIDEDALLGALHEMGVLDAFTDEVYAADDSNIDVTVKKKGKNEFQFNVVLKDPKDKNKELEISFGVKCKSLAKYDKKTAIIDNSLTVTSGMEFTVKGKDKEHIEKSIKAALKDYGNASDVESSQGQYEVPFVPIKIPLVGPVCLNIELGLTSDVTFSAEFNAGMETSLKFSQGVIYDVKKQKEIKKYADITGDVDAHLLVHGTLDAFAGIYGDTSLDIPLLIELGINAKAGPYLDSEGLFSITGIPDDIKSKGHYKLEIGVSCNANWTIQILTFDEKSNPIVDRKRPLLTRSKYLDLKDTSLQDQYYLIDKGIKIGDLTATYHNVIENKDQKGKIEEYTLYVDDNSIEVKDGKVQDGLSEGTHKIKLEWDYDGDHFKFEKDIKIIKYNPWDQFDEATRYMGMSAGKLCDQYNLQKDTEEYGLDGSLYESDLDIKLGFPTAVWYRENRGCAGWRDVYVADEPCSGIKGTGSSILGIKQNISASDLASLMETKFKILDLARDFDYEHIIYSGTFTHKGVEYMMICSSKRGSGVISPEDECEIWLYSPVCLM